MEVTTSSRECSVTAAPPGVLRAGCEWFQRGVAWASVLLSDLLFQIGDEFRGGVSGYGFDGHQREIKWVIQPIYHEILPFRGELALVQMDSTSFQYINRSGETVWKLPETDKTAWNKEAFLESFKKCETSIYMQKQGSRTMYEYEIKQSAAEGGGCVVESRFLLNKNLEWINKTMTCTYDNSLPFEKAIQPCLPNDDENNCGCEGELWDIMSKQK